MPNATNANLRGAGSFGARACRAMRAKLLTLGESSLPPSWRRRWMIQRILATPPWVDMKEIRKVYIRAAELSAETGQAWTVGHIVPLNHPRVCGLHVPWNIQPELASANFSKGNAWCEWHGDLFEDPEQLRLF